MKTVRFKEIVAVCGRPEVHVSWSKPQTDPQLMKALKQNRVMTLHQTVRGTTKDFGTVGLLVDAHAQILIFPRSLKKFTDRRVVGIDYSTIGEAGTAVAASSASRAQSRTEPKKKPPSARDNSEADTIAPLHSSVTRPQPQPKPPEPPATKKEIATAIAEARAAFAKQNYAGAADVFEKIATQLRRET